MCIDPNTGNLSPDDFDRVEKPLIRIDKLLQRFADGVGATIWKNYHGRPARDVVLESTDGITRRIEIAPILRHPAVKPQPAQIKVDYAVTIYAYRKATLGEGKLRAESVTTFKELPSTSPEVKKLLNECWEKLK